MTKQADTTKIRQMMASLKARVEIPKISVQKGCNPTGSGLTAVVFPPVVPEAEMLSEEAVTDILIESADLYHLVKKLLGAKSPTNREAVRKDLLRKCLAVYKAIVSYIHTQKVEEDWSIAEINPAPLSINQAIQVLTCAALDYASWKPADEYGEHSLEYLDIWGRVYGGSDIIIYALADVVAGCVGGDGVICMRGVEQDEPTTTCIYSKWTSLGDQDE